MPGENQGDLGVRATMEGGPQVAADVAKIETSMNRLGAAAATTGSKFGVLTVEERKWESAIQRARVDMDRFTATVGGGAGGGGGGKGAIFQIQQLGSTLGIAAGGFGRLGGSGQQVVAVIGQATGAIAALSMGLGPIGAAITIATTAFSILTMVLSDTEEQTEDTRREVERTTRSIRDLIGAIEESNAAQALRSRIAAGAASVTEFQAAAQEEADAISALRAERRRIARPDDREHLRTSDEQGRINQIEREIRSRQERLAHLAREAQAVQEAENQIMIEDAEAAAEAEAERDRRRGGGDDRARRAAEEERERRGFFDMVSGLRGQGQLGAGLDDGWLAEADRAAEQEARVNEARLDRLDDLGEAVRNFRDETVRTTDDVIEAWTRMNEVMEETSRTQMSTGALVEESLKNVGRAAVENLGTMARGAFEDSVDAFVDGELSFGKAAEKMAKGIVSALVKRSIVEAAVEGAAALGALASFNFPAAAAHGAAAAAWAGVAAVAGSVGLATGAVGGGRGKGGDSRSAADRGPAARSSTQEQSLTIIQNINAPVDNPAKMGEWFARNIREARRLNPHIEI